ncbi:hypothetical protein G3W13_26795, partial [Klebsiella pneumoniae]|nr:hypothetical protein [Klebsiella pneumoniae]
KACVLPENPASYRVVRTKSYLFNKANGKYQVGPFTLTYEFIVKYMALIHKTEIPESWLTDNGTSLDERRVLYMEASDILTKDIVREIRKTVKSPQDQLQVYRINDQIITLEMMEK